MKKLLFISTICISLFASIAMAAKSKYPAATLYVDAASQQFYQIKTIRLYVPGSTTIPLTCFLKNTNECTLRLTTEYVIEGASDSVTYSNALCENSQPVLQLKAGDNYLVLKGSAKENDVKCSLSQNP